ncbi:MAG TPA: ParB N-terminal domain-containing protein [Cytophagales bacterium]|nr:ParB N-terminal domain-containing protein [Cytophagales bacterium]
MNTPTKTTYSVYKTSNYGMFRPLTGNRSVNFLHVKRLVQSFQNKHLISVLIVNEKYEVIDGQHRLDASKVTGVPIYFIVVPGYSLKEVQIYNTNQKEWKKIDFLKMYCDMGLDPYQKFKEFMNDFPDFGIMVTERILTQLRSNGRTGKVGDQKASLRDFEEGNLHVPDLEKSYDIALKLMDFKPYYPGYNRGTFVSCMLGIFEHKNYNHKEMIKKVELNPKALVDCTNVEAYKLLIENIYNYRRNKENKVSLRYD